MQFRDMKVGQLVRVKMSDGKTLYPEVGTIVKLTGGVAYQKAYVHIRFPPERITVMYEYKRVVAA